MHIQCSRIWGCISKAVDRHTSVFSAICPVHIRYRQLPIQFGKSKPGISNVDWKGSIFRPWYWRWRIADSRTWKSNAISLYYCLILWMRGDLRGICDSKRTKSQPDKHFENCLVEYVSGKAEIRCMHSKWWIRVTLAHPFKTDDCVTISNTFTF